MGGKLGASLSRRGISGFVKGLWRTCDGFLQKEEEQFEQVRCFAGNGKGWAGTLLVMYDVSDDSRLLTY